MILWNNSRTKEGDFSESAELWIMARSEVGALLGEGWVHSREAPESRARSGNTHRPHQRMWLPQHPGTPPRIPRQPLRGLLNRV